MKLRAKFILIYCFFVILPVTAITLTFIWKNALTTEQHVVEYSENLFQSANEQIEQDLDQIGNTIDYLSLNSNDPHSIVKILEDLSDSQSAYSSYDMMTTSRYCSAAFQDLMLINDHINGIYLITPDSAIIGASNGTDSTVNFSHDCGRDLWYQQTIALSGGHYVSTFLSDDLFTDHSPSLYIARSMNNVYSHKYLGTIVLDCDPSVLDLDSLMTIPDLVLLSVSNTQTGETLYSNVDSLKGPYGKYTDGKQTARLSVEPLELSVSFNYSQLYEQFDQDRSVIIFLLVSLISAILLGLFLLTHTMIRPIETLSRTMSRQQELGLKFVSPYPDRHDEIGILYEQYSSMLDKLDLSIKKEYKDKLILLDAQMKSLEARINSHFLFNTLESINSMAELADNKAIANMSLALGNMFRYSIKTKSELVSLADELQHVKDYVSIQKIRFSDRFRLDTDIPSPLLSCKMLKLLLQPLVENALYHGLSYCTTGDAIAVRARADKGLLFITVSDNGTGMDPEKLEQVRAALDKEPQFTELGHRSGESIGLKNIHARIRLYYGADFGLTIQSQKGAGSDIQICIPLIRPASVSGSGSAAQGDRHVSLSHY